MLIHLDEVPLLIVIVCWYWNFILSLSICTCLFVLELRHCYDVNYAVMMKNKKITRECIILRDVSDVVTNFIISRIIMHTAMHTVILRDALHIMKNSSISKIISHDVMISWKIFSHEFKTEIPWMGIIRTDMHHFIWHFTTLHYISSLYYDIHEWCCGLVIVELWKTVIVYTFICVELQVIMFYMYSIVIEWKLLGCVDWFYAYCSLWKFGLCVVVLVFCIT